MANRPIYVTSTNGTYDGLKELPMVLTLVLKFPVVVQLIETLLRVLVK